MVSCSLCVTMAKTILNALTAARACGSFAGIMRISPALTRHFLPEIMIPLIQIVH